MGVTRRGSAQSGSGEARPVVAGRGKQRFGVAVNDTASRGEARYRQGMQRLRAPGQGVELIKALQIARFQPSLEESHPLGTVIFAGIISAPTAYIWGRLIGII